MRWGLNAAPVLLLILGLLLAACSPTVAAPQTTPAAGTQPAAVPPLTGSESVSGPLVVYSGRSEPLIQPVLDAFQQQYPEVEILLKSGSNSELANALLEEQNNPQADVFITTELFTIQALQNEGLFQSYRPAAAAGLPSEAIGPEDQWMGLTRRARVIMYNRELVPEDQVPQSIFDLTGPQWQGQIAAAGSTNGSMQAQIAVLRDLIGEEATEDWLRGLQANEVTFFGGHTDVRKAVGAGEFKLGLVNHYYYYLQQEEGSLVGIVFPDQGEGEIGLITNLTAVAILNGSRNLPAAQALVDFLLSPLGQQTFAEENYEYPLIPGVPLNPAVQPLDDFRLADTDIARAAEQRDETFALIEKVGLP